MANEFDGYCPEEIIIDAAIANPEISAALLAAREAGIPGVCGAVVVSQEIFSGDRQPCLTVNDCIFRR